MSEHLDLFGLLHGELDNTETIAAGDHLATCTTCQEELADAVVGHSLLTRASRTLGPTDEAPVPPPLTRPLPPVRRRGRVLLAAAAAVVLAAAVTGAVWWRDADTRTPARGVEAALSPLSATESGDGRVRMVEDDGHTRMTVAVRDLPAATSGEFYYAWLLDPSTNKMLALGLVDPDRGVTFDLDDALIASYSAIDVSLETDDGDPAHSDTSVLRGTYEPDQITTSERIHP